MKTEPKKFENMNCCELKEHCSWEGPSSVWIGGYDRGHPILCKKELCKEAYENYLKNFESEEIK